VPRHAWHRYSLAPFGFSEIMPLSSSLPRCSSTWDDSRNEPREGEFAHHCVACQRRMLVRFRALSGHRTTLTSSGVASFDAGPLSGYGYGPTLTSSVVALRLARLRDAGAVGVVQSFSRSIMENQTVADCHVQLGYGTMMIPVRCASFKVFSRSIAVYNMPGTGELWHLDKADKSSRQAPSCRPLFKICRDSRWTAHGMCLLL
jgi:hypothetical protein